MKVKITEKWLVSRGACEAGVEAFKNQTEANSLKILKNLIRVKKLGWANWLIARVMTYEQYVAYAVFAAEQVIGIFGKKYPNDNRPRAAINAAKKCIKNPSRKNKQEASAAALASAAVADSAAYAAGAAYAAYAAYAADTAYAAADAAYAAADAAYAADVAYAAYAAVSAADAAYAATTKMKLKILKYGITLLEGGK